VRWFHSGLLLLGVLSGPRVALAQPAVEGGSTPRFAVVLRSDEPRLWIEITPDAEGVKPVATCFAPCRVLLAPGDYRVQVEGYDPDLEGSWSLLSVSGDAELRIRTPRRHLRRLGAGVGTTGIVALAEGTGLMTVGLFATALIHDETCSDEYDYSLSCREGRFSDWVSPLVPVGVGIMGAGAALTVTGWHTFVRNTGPRFRAPSSPHVRAITATWRVTPARVGDGIGLAAGLRF